MNSETSKPVFESDQALSWQVWRNPIFIRYCRSRLRPVSFTAWASVTLVLTGFIFFMSFLGSQKWGGSSEEDAAALTFVSIIVIQCALLMFKGGFNMATGVTREGIEGILDYQRLSPMSPLSKALGYLFGLPVQEWALFGLTLPFLGYVVVVGELPFLTVGRVYAVMVPAVLLYHMTGFLACMVVKQRFLAQILMVLLYFILPHLSNIGYVFFEYLTIRPVLFDELAGIVPEWKLQEPVKFYDFDVPVWLFSITMQASLFGVFLMVVIRKWRNENAHLLGKHASVLTLGGVLAVLLGTILPLIPDGKIFPPFLRDNISGEDANIADAVELDEAQEDAIFPIIARSQPGYREEMQFEGVSGSDTTPISDDTIRDSAIQSVLRPDQMEAWDTYQRRQEILGGFGVTNF